MTESRFDLKISLGNMLTIGAVVIGAVAAFYQQSVTIEALRGELRIEAGRLQSDVSVLKTRLNGLESEINTRLTRIETGQDRLNAKLDRLIESGWTRN